MSKKYDIIIYQSLTNPYMRLIRVADGGIVAASDWSTSKTTAWGDSDITLTKNDLIGGIPVNISSDLEPGDYDILFYDAASPADSDAVQLGKRIAWSGHAILGLPLDI